MEKRGLSEAEAKRKLAQFGPNEITDISKTTAIRILLRQVKNNFIVYLLLGAVLISFFVGKTITAYVIFCVIIMVVGLGFVQEYKADKAIKALKKMILPFSLVIRDGKEKDVLSSVLVPGDLLLLRSGERIPADCLVLEETSLSINEALLTGEAKEVRKEAAKDGLKPAEQNLLFMGSFIVNGKCLARVQHTGMCTHFGNIAKMISTTEKELPLQQKVNKIAKYMALVAVIVSLLTGLLMVLQAEALTSEFLVSVLILVIALSVSAFPEGLPVVLITALAFGARRMAKQNAIVNRMSIIETLGETTVICSDKTGTITAGEMTVRKIVIDRKDIDVEGIGYAAAGRFLLEKKEIHPLSDPTLLLLLKTAVLCNDSRIELEGETQVYRGGGLPTEIALLILAAKAGIVKENVRYTRLKEIPFSSERKMMSVLCELEKKNAVFVKGAPEVVLDHCTFIRKQNKIVPLSSAEKKGILNANRMMTSKTLRTLAFATKDLSVGERTKKRNSGVQDGELENDLIFLGLTGMEDPPRAGVKEAIMLCQHAGIEIKMITGDNKETALAIAREINLSGEVLEGHELEKLSPAELRKVIRNIAIFARVKPEHKLQIVKALKSRGEIVTMTGDGVNDAPALKEAHIGVAMGRNGTDVSREAADLILKDDNFITMVSAIEEGRRIFRNIRKFVTYQLSCNLTELLVLFCGVLLSPLLGWQIPLLLALQILFINLVTDNLPAITLGLNPSSADVMSEKPRRKAELLSKNLFVLLFFTGILIALFVLAVFYLSFNVFQESIGTARTTALVSLILLEIASAFNFRSFRKGVFTRSLFANRPLVFASLISLAATVVVIYTPLQVIFETTALSLGNWATAVFLALLLVLIFDILKRINNKTKFIDLWK
ncbi:cation-transporting P-type ATPase [Candidatus Woesearchaeota archaeon]|nr:cation-transporting P-type ATPase [Candidatus Woesearchaeota archaeon]